MITHSPGATIFTGDSISYFRLCSLKGMVGLECKGILIRSRGRRVWRIVKDEFGIRGNKYAVYRWLCEEVERLRPQQEHEVKR